MAERTFLGWLLIGLVAGLLAKLLVPGRDPGGFVVTVLIGIAGALLAGFVAEGAGVAIADGWTSYGAATLGAIVLLLLYRVVIARRR
ncbi:GlsB/YeaQ/YmgE family stress response membrane protein [Sphingomonas sp.]|uniref:GlsB/YeaQ/YmgE family stress response membrane protein n=1 Tax=Sphingomonas sp. TaxID=28214 RepID=UPI002DD61F60|nr:GlsB/YeaQ/YmgE family stress response membrane protein [Sphingomonas sp.]